MIKSGPFLLIESSYQNANFVSKNLSLIFFKVSTFREFVWPNNIRLGFKFSVILKIFSSIEEKLFNLEKVLSLKFIICKFSLINPFEILLAKLILYNL